MKRAIRDQLEALSLKSYGTKTAWRKVMKQQGYQIPVGLKPAKTTAVRYVKKGGTIYKESTAVEKFGFKPQPQQEQKSVVNYREPTPEELIFMMDRAYQDMVVAKVLRDPVQPHHPTFVLAYLYKHDRLSWEVRLHKSSDTDDYNSVIEELLAKVEQKDTDKFNGWLLKDGEDTTGAIDYEEFLNEFNKLDENSDTEFNEIFAAAEKDMPFYRVG